MGTAQPFVHSRWNISKRKLSRADIFQHESLIPKAWAFSLFITHFSSCITPSVSEVAMRYLQTSNASTWLGTPVPYLSTNKLSNSKVVRRLKMNFALHCKDDSHRNLAFNRPDPSISVTGFPELFAGYLFMPKTPKPKFLNFQQICAPPMLSEARILYAILNTFLLLRIRHYFISSSRRLRCSILHSIAKAKFKVAHIRAASLQRPASQLRMASSV